jgi:putative RecB family exonuclease
MAIQQLWPDTKEVELIWHYLIFDQEVRSRRGAEELEALRKDTISLIDEIETATEFPARQTGLCNWCEYRPLCPLFKHLYETAALSKNDYLSEEGVALAERLAALQVEEERIKTETQKVKEALFAYAQKKGVEVVFTKTHKVRMKVYDNIRFPGKNDPSRPALEKVVKEGGKWEEVSTLDVFALSKALQNKPWEAELVARIKKLGTPDKSPWIKVFPRDERRG